MKHLGYHTVAFIANPMGGSSAGLDQGFDEFTERRWLGKPVPGEAVPDIHLLQPLFDWATREHGDVPQFLYVHTAEPHDPYEGALHDPAGRFVGTQEERDHLRMLMNVERRLGVQQYSGGPSPAGTARRGNATAEPSGRAQDLPDLYDGDVRRASGNFH